MTPLRDRGVLSWRGWVPALLLGAVLAGCAGTAPEPRAATDAAPTTEPTTDTEATGATDATSRPGSGMADAAVAAGEPASTPDVECGLTVLSDAQQVMRYCGQDTASVELPLRTLEFTGAECDVSGSFATVNAGVSYSDPESAAGDYVGVVLGGLESGAQTPADHVAGELVVRGTTLGLRDLEATVDLRGDALVATVVARTVDDGPVRIVLDCR